jgi:ribonuclease H / adenosylcobalamin/alpha-ribazole phosphatase
VTSPAADSADAADPADLAAALADVVDPIAARVIVEADGGARGNPGPAGFGAVVRDDATESVLAERSGSLGVTTNNVAEYTGLIEGLAAATDLGARDVTVRMDSKLVVEQMSGRWQIRHHGLRPLAAKAAALVARFDAVRFEWVPRERNKHADALANRAMDEAAGVVSDRGAPADRASRSWTLPAGTPTRMILVRHGRTAYTAEGRYSGRGDVPLSEPGRAEAVAVAERVDRLVRGRPDDGSATSSDGSDRSPVAAIITSPLVRATATADAINARLGGDRPIRIEPDLIECDFGAWEGHTFAEVADGWPEQMQRWLDSPAVAPPDGESFRAVATRVRRVAAGLRAAYPAQTIVVVSHVTPIKVLLRDALAAGDAFLYRLHLDPAGLSVVDSWPDGGVSVRAVNDTSHL